MITPEALLERARSGEVAPTARLLSIVENDEPGAERVVRATFPDVGRAIRIGITGSPGTGKSTLVAALLAAYRRVASRVAVVAVDPSSPYTGGAILGDRIRMRETSLDRGVFIRSMSNRGASGGLARATGRVVDLLDALGFEVILVETVGAGQQEIDVIRLVDSVCVLTIPGAGDDIQAIKAGILEIADVLVVNKADKPGADQAVKELTQMLTLGEPRNDWRPPVLRTSATTGDGIDELVAALARHRDWARQCGETERRHHAAMRTEIEALMRERVLRDLARRIDATAVAAAASRVLQKELDPYDAAELLLAGPEGVSTT
ncbi:MAG: methylmalonyl Co-A mutase-associated GTPase MeaB [Gemmatimonadales bacterium]